MILPFVALLAAASAPGTATAQPPLAALTDRYAGAAAIVPAKKSAAPTRAEVERAVAAEWPRYDLDRTGRLTPLEFSTWVMHANGAEVAPAGVPAKEARGISPVSAMNATARAFAKADADHDNGITREELVDFLTRAAPAGTATVAAKAARAPASKHVP